MRISSAITQFGIILSVLLTLSFAKAEDCGPLINDSIHFLQEIEPGVQHFVGFAITSIKAPAKFVSYASGSLQAVGGSSGRFPIATYLKGKDLLATFSDRTWCPELPGGSFCTGYQGFNYKAADTQQLFLYPNGTAKVVLTTWGNASYTFPLTCTDGFLHGTLVEPNGNSMMVISLNKGRVSVPR